MNEDWSDKDAVDGDLLLQLLDLGFQGAVVTSYLVQLSKVLLGGGRVVHFHRQRLVHQGLTGRNLLFIQVNPVALSLEDIVNNLPLQVLSELILPDSLSVLVFPLVVLMHLLSLRRALHVLLQQTARAVG